MAEAKRTYKELDVIAIPEDVPEVGIKAGTLGAVVDVMPDGTLVVDVVDKETGRTIDMLYVAPEPEPRVVGRWHLGEQTPDQGT